MAIAFDNGTGLAYVFASSVVGSHTVNANNNGILLFNSWPSGPGGSGTSKITSVTANGSNMTRLNQVALPDGTVTDVWYLLAPPLGAISIVGTASQDIDWEVALGSYTGVKQTGIPDASQLDSGTAGSDTNSVLSIADNCWHIMGVGTQNGAPSASTGATQRAKSTPGGTDHSAIYDGNGAITPPAVNSISITIGGAGQSYGVVGFTLAPAVNSGVNNLSLLRTG